MTALKIHLVLCADESLLRLARLLIGQAAENPKPDQPAIRPEPVPETASGEAREETTEEPARPNQVEDLSRIEDDVSIPVKRFLDRHDGRVWLWQDESFNAPLLRAILARDSTVPAVVAREVGVSESTVSGWKHGKSRPTVQNVARLCEILGIDPSRMVTTKT